MQLDQRVLTLLGMGWVDEVKSLLGKGVLQDSPAFRAIGYSEISSYINGELNYGEMVDSVQIQTRQYAKRQRAWMRSEPNLIPVVRTGFGSPSVDEIKATLIQLK